MLFMVGFLVIIAIAATVVILLLAPSRGEPSAKVVVVHTPPAQEECKAIGGGVILVDQLALVRVSFTFTMKSPLHPKMIWLLLSSL